MQIKTLFFIRRIAFSQAKKIHPAFGDEGDGFFKTLIEYKSPN